MEYLGSGFTLHFTAKLPTDAQAALVKQRSSATASFALTPDWGVVPELDVYKLVQEGVTFPKHWGDNDVIQPIIEDTAFYIVPEIQRDQAVSFAIGGVNLRTGLRETSCLTDDPTQSYWTGNSHTPWIDGYVPGDGQAVRQFVPLRGAIQMTFDVSDSIGIGANDPEKDALTAQFYLPRIWNKYHPPELNYRGGSMTLGSSSPTSLGQTVGDNLLGSRSNRKVFTLGVNDQPERVGMGAGARMCQRHAVDTTAEVGDYMPSPYLTMSTRLVWVEDWNRMAAVAGAKKVRPDLIANLGLRQTEYETQIRSSLGLNVVNTDVDSFKIPIF